MALSPRLELRQGQGLVITPQLQQAIKLLQLSSLELEAYVEGELERNPLLQRDEREGEAEAPAEVERTADISETALDQISEAAAAADIDARSDDLYAEVFSRREDLSDRVGETGGEGYQTGGAIDWTRAGRGGGFDGEEGGLEGGMQRAKTLAEHLADQLGVSGLLGAEHAIAQVLVDGVDEGGYLRLDLVEVAERLGCTVKKVEAVLLPAAGLRAHHGVFARDVAECLRLQLVLEPGDQSLRSGHGRPAR